VHVRRRDLLRYPDFRRLLTSQFISQVADALTTFTLAEMLLFTFSDGPSLKAMGIGFVLAAIPLLTVGPIAGNLADRYRRNFLLWSGHVIRAMATLLLVPMVVWRIEVLGYVVFGLLISLSRVLYTARATSLPRLVRRHELVAAGSSSLIAGVIAGSVGAGLGSVIASALPIVAIMIASIGHFLAARGYGKIESDLGGADGHRRVSFLSARRDLISAKTRFVILSTMSHRLLLGGALAGIALFIDRTLHLDTTGYVAVLGAAAIGSFCGSVASEWFTERLTKRSITYLAFLIGAAAMTVAALFVQPLIGLCAVTFTAFSFQILRIRADATVQANSRSESVGHIFAAYDILYNASFIAGGTLGMVVSQRYGLTEILGGVAIAYCIGAVVFRLLPDGKGQAPNDATASRISALRIESRDASTQPSMPAMRADTASTIMTNASAAANRSSWVPMEIEDDSRQDVKASPSPERMIAPVPVTTSD
jgi:predicted MFS family arabinose efflux permease